MTNEAERLAIELTEDIEGFPEPTQLERKAAALLRQQAAQIDAMKVALNNMADALDDQSETLIRQAAEVERLNVKTHIITKYALRFEQKDAEIERLKAERDAAFDLSRCECASDEACANQVRKDALLLEALTAIGRVFNYDGDVFGVHHNDVMDLLGNIKKELK